MRIKNTLLAIIAALLLLNLGVNLSSTVHALPRTQYKAVEVKQIGSAQASIQQTLDQESAQGWNYVGDLAGCLIFKK